MEGRKMEVSIVLGIVALLLWAGEAVGQSSDCNNVLITLSPCLNYINANSSTPSPSCCSQLTTVLRSQPQCLCQVFDNGSGGGASALGGLNGNQTLALALPAACRLQTPPISRCNVASPTNDSHAETPESSKEKPTEVGSRRNVPTTGEDGTPNGTSTILLSKAMLFIFILASTFSSLTH